MDRTGPRDIMKLDRSKVRWIIRRKLDGTMHNRQIAETVDISVTWVQKLWAGYRNTNPADIIFPENMGRPKKGRYGHRERNRLSRMNEFVKNGSSYLTCGIFFNNLINLA